MSAGQELAGEWRRLVTVTLYAWLHLTMFIPKGTHYTTACFRLLCLEVYLLYSYTVMALVASFDQSCFGALVAPLPPEVKLASTETARAAHAGSTGWNKNGAVDS